MRNYICIIALRDDLARPKETKPAAERFAGFCFWGSNARTS